MAQGDIELDQVQIYDWDEEAEEDEAAVEEEELVRIKQEIVRLWQEQEYILRRQAAAQHVLVLIKYRFHAPTC
jgi:hypothetical protein